MISFSDVIGKFGRTLGVVIFMFNISFQNVSYIFVTIVQSIRYRAIVQSIREPLYETIGSLGTPGMCIFG